MRVGFFTEIYRPVVNGVVASVDALAAGLRARQHEVFCFAPSAPGYDEPVAEVVVRMPSLPLPTSSPYRLTLPLVSRRNRVGVIKRLDVIHAHSPFVTGWMGARYARRYRVPFVYTYHTQLEAYAHYVPFDPKATRRAANSLTRRFANLATTVIVPTEAMGDRLREIGVRAPIEIVPSAIDIEHFGSGVRRESVRRSLGVGASDRLLLFVSRLAREKNVQLLLEALALCPDHRLRLVIGGDGPDRQSLEERARKLRLRGRVRFVGEVARHALPDLYASADAFVFPSVSETQGLVLAEALAAGSPVVAADTPQNRDVLGPAGVLVPPNAHDFEAAMRAAQPADESRRQAAKTAAARFGIERQAERIEAVYEQLCRASKAASSG